MKQIWIVMIGALLCAACQTGGAMASGRTGSDGPGDVAGGQLADVPIDEALSPFEVELNGVYIAEEMPATTKPDARPDADQHAEFEAASGPVCRRLTFRGPTFASNKIVLSDDGRQVLERLLEALAQHACSTDEEHCQRDDVSVLLTGHTDDRPTALEGGNLQLSKDRARAVAAVFMEYGFLDVRAEGRADTEPAPAPLPDTRTIDEVRADNRRVTIDIYCL